MDETGGAAAAPSSTATTTTGNSELEVGGTDSITIKVSYGLNSCEVVTAPQSTFGVKDNAKVKVMENSPTEDADLGKLEQVEENIKEISRGLEAVNLVRQEINQFAEQVVSLETVVCSGTQVADKDFVFLTEMLMRKLLKLDEIDAEGEGRTQRKLEVLRVQGLVETLDNLRAKNSNLTSNVPEKADEPSLPSSSKVTQEWEVFE